MSQFIPLTAFAPDEAPTNPGLIVACNGWIPSPKGYRTAYSAGDAGHEALAAACTGLYISRLNDGTTEIYAGTATKLYQLSNGSWLPKTRTASDYTTVTDWRFATQGNTTYAISLQNLLQENATDPGDKFADVASGPKAKFIATALGFVIVAYYDDGTVTPDGWWCCAQYDPADWTPAAATQCAKGRLLDTPGPITALKTLNDTLVVFKERSVFQGTYGLPFVWNWRLVSPDVGAVSQEAVVDIGYALAWVGYDGIYTMSGDAVPQRIDAGIRDWFYDRIDRQYLYKAQGMWDRDRALVYWWYPTAATGDGTLTDYIVYHVPSRRWGAGSTAIERTGETLSASETWDGFFPGYASWNDLPSFTYDSGIWNANRPFPTIVNTSHKICYLSGSAGKDTLPSLPTLTTGLFGSDDVVSLVRRFTPRWTDAPTTATLTNYYSMVTPHTMTADTGTSMSGSRYRFDFLRAAKWHQFTLVADDDAELSGYALDVKASGEE